MVRRNEKFGREDSHEIDDQMWLHVGAQSFWPCRSCFQELQVGAIAADDVVAGEVPLLVPFRGRLQIIFNGFANPTTVPDSLFD